MVEPTKGAPSLVQTWEGVKVKKACAPFGSSDIKMETSTCPFCGLSLPSSELEW